MDSKMIAYLLRIYDRLNESFKHAIDSISIAGTVGTIMGYLPDVTALLTFVWVAIRLYETRTIQGWLGRKPVATSDE